NFCSKIIHREVLFSVNWLSLTLFYRRDFLFCMDFFIYTKYFILSNNTVEENNYLKKASKFVYKIQKNYKTFIIAPYNYATIQENNKEFFIGQKVYPNFEDGSVAKF
uniref:hypothetical protein n=1 Tax=Enterococcus faecium TaxID=1352 RepID=UPI001CC93462